MPNKIIAVRRVLFAGLAVLLTSTPALAQEYLTNRAKNWPKLEHLHGSTIHHNARGGGGWGVGGGVVVVNIWQVTI